MVPRKSEKSKESAGVIEKQESTDDYNEDDYGGLQFDEPEINPTDQELISKSVPTTPLEIALKAELERRTQHVDRLTAEVTKLKTFISKRKQTYKRKRKEEGAPRKSLSAYNLFVRERFAKLAKDNEAALKSADTDQQLKRVPPASQVAAAGNAWRALSAEEKSKYEDM